MSSSVFFVLQLCILKNKYHVIRDDHQVKRTYNLFQIKQPKSFIDHLSFGINFKKSAFKLGKFWIYMQMNNVRTLYKM